MENHAPTTAGKNTDHATAAGFTPPRHWLGPEELTQDYWSDPKVREKRGQEFHDKPVETIDLIDRVDAKGLARRDFLTIMGASMAMASFACARRPVHKIIPYVIKPEEITPGVANYYASTHPETGAGLLVKTREGRPIKLEGNPDHPVNRGAITGREQAAVLSLYDPERAKEPVARSRADGARRTVTWEEADSAIQAQLKSLAAGPGRIRILSGPIAGDSTRKLIAEFLSAFKAGAHVEFEPLRLSEIWDSQNECYGAALLPTYHFDRADYVVALGSDFMGTGNSPVEHMNDWSKARKLGADGAASSAKSKAFSKLVTFESMMTLTGANSDERFPVRPGDELKVALALAHEIIVGKKASRFAGDGQIAAALAGYKPETVATEIGIEGGAERLKKIAHDLWQSRGKSLVIGGSIQSRTDGGLALQVAVNLLNSALENEGVTVDGTLSADLRPAAGFDQAAKLLADIKAGQVDALIIYGSNPAYALPRGLGFEDALKKVPFVISVTQLEDETAQFADFILPDHHFLENWGDAHPRQHYYSLQQPTLGPIVSSRAFQDSLLTWIRGAGLKAGSSAAKIAAAPADANGWHDYLKAHWHETVYKEYGVSNSFEQFWEGVLRDGVFNGLAARGLTNARPTARAFRAAAVAKLPKYAAMSEPLVLALYAKSSMHDGRDANNAWLQEMPDPVTTMTWDNYINIGPGLAKKLGVEGNDVVALTAGDISVELPVHIQPGLHMAVVTAAVGYGRRHSGKVGTLVGVDMFPFARAEGGRLIFAGTAAKIRKTGKFYRLAETQWHHTQEGRPILNDITLAEYKTKPGTVMETDPELKLEKVPSIWPTHAYTKHRWGMAIDLTSCTGCGACVIGCQAENNIPTVGRDNVRVSREMHWIRIDRYYSGNPESPDVVFQPMLCQQCENAPCETVCPVLATVHSDEGLNEQVYNRCVGTRYCQNNCPYKVRRFNFFDHWKSYEGTANLVWNPDVTVRTRGIMEKCTFCVQRIRDGKDKAKDMGEKLADGAIKTACQQTCPTDAIVFGDMNDPGSRISKLKVDPRAFRSLEVLNTKPSITYLTKVRNKPEGAGAHESEDHHA